MCFAVVAYPVALVELAANDESQHSLLFASGVMEALEYGIMHDFTLFGMSVSAYAAGAAVALVGKQEGGRTLSREAVFAVLKRLHEFFTDGSTWAGAPFGEMTAQFGDTQLGALCAKYKLQQQMCSVQNVHILVDDNSKLKTTWQASSDGEVVRFETTQDKWINFTDSFGTK